MANYLKATDFGAKDALISGDPNKIIKGAEINDEFDSIQTAVNSKANVNNAALTGTPTAPTATTGTDTLQLATTAFVNASINAFEVQTGDIADDAVTTAKIAPTGVTAGAYGSSSAIPVVTVNAEGQVTSATTQAVVSSLRLINKTQVFGAGTSNGGTISVSLPTSLFGGNTPSFVMFSANARTSGLTDLRYFYMCSGTDATQQNMVLASTSDDTDQNGVGRADAASTFVLPYSASQSFYTALYGATLYINVIGYQV
jgi:hypothetical protein